IPKLGAVFGADGSVTVYVLTWMLLAAVLGALHRLTQAPFGRVLQAIGQEETKARSLGYPVFVYKLAALLISAGLAGLGGALHAHHTGFVSPHTLHWATSGTFLIMVLLGGREALLGGVLGAAVYVVFEAWVSGWTDLWHLGVGAML